MTVVELGRINVLLQANVILKRSYEDFLKSTAQTAITFEAGDPVDLAEKIAWVFTHPEQAAAIGRAASRLVHEQFTVESQLDALETYLESQIEKQSLLAPI